MAPPRSDAEFILRKREDRLRLQRAVGLIMNVKISGAWGAWVARTAADVAHRQWIMLSGSSHSGDGWGRPLPYVGLALGIDVEPVEYFADLPLRRKYITAVSHLARKYGCDAFSEWQYQWRALKVLKEALFHLMNNALFQAFGGWVARTEYEKAYRGRSKWSRLKDVVKSGGQKLVRRTKTFAAARRAVSVMLNLTISSAWKTWASQTRHTKRMKTSFFAVIAWRKQSYLQHTFDALWEWRTGRLLGRRAIKHLLHTCVARAIYAWKARVDGQTNLQQKGARVARWMLHYREYRAFLGWLVRFPKRPPRNPS